MPITMRWADERKNLFIFDLQTGDWTWRQYDLAVEQAMNMVKLVDHDVAAMILASSAFPEGNAITHMLRVIKLQPANLKLYIVVGGNMLTRTLNNLMMQMFPKTRIIFTASESAAYKLAAKHGFQTDDPV